MIAKLEGYAIHPAANLFPMMPDAEIEALAADIGKNGRLSNAHPVRFWKGRKGSNPGLPPFSKEAVSAYRKLACNTQQAIADSVGVTEEAIRQQTQEMADLPKLGKPDQSAADHVTDFDPPLYNVWKQQSKSNKVGHFGNTQQEIADAVGCSIGDVNAICSEMADLPNLNKPDQSAADHATDFDPPLYNVWKQQSKSNEVGHFGNTQQEIADAVGTPRQTVDDEIQSFAENGKPAKLGKTDQSSADHATDLRTVAGVQHATENCRRGRGSRQG